MSSRIVEVKDNSEFRELLKKDRDRIRINPHAYFRINEAQRKIYNDEYLLDFLLNESPLLVGLQQNGRYAAFYKRKENYLRIIIAVYSTYIEVITFIITDSLPNIK